MILRDLELRTAKWLVSAYSKGVSECWAEEADEARVYSSGMITRNRNKVKGKVRIHRPKTAATLYREVGWRCSVIVPTF